MKLLSGGTRMKTGILISILLSGCGGGNGQPLGGTSSEKDNQVLIITFSNSQSTINCKENQNAEVTGSNNDLTASRCKNVKVTGNDNTIRYAGNTSVTLLGSGNIKIPL